MPRDQRIITQKDILSPAEYDIIRKEKRQENILRKKYSHIDIGPHARFGFESWDSMWLQIQEMLRIEKGGDLQLADELEAYNPMIPNGYELTGTLMFEIEDEARRDAFLRTIGGVEQHIWLVIGEQRVIATPEADVERTNAAGKASAVHFLHFSLSDPAIAAIHEGKGRMMMEIDHPQYGHAALLSKSTRRWLVENCL